MVAVSGDNTPLHCRNLEKKFGVWYAEHQRKVSMGVGCGLACLLAVK